MAELLGASKKKGQQGSSYTPAEDGAIAKAWISTSENAIDGTEQKAEHFILKVQNVYNDSFKPANREVRSFESVKSRVKMILKQGTSFSACYARVIRQRPSGSSDNDCISLATGLYNGMSMTTVSEDCGKPFKFREAWEVLRGHENFKTGILSSRPTSANASSNSAIEECAWSVDVDDCTNNTEDIIDKEVIEKEVRPVGQRQAKEDKRKEKYNQEKLSLAAQAVAAETELNNVLKRQYEIMLFSSSPDGCDESESIEYFKIMRTIALQEVRRELEKRHQQDRSSDDEANDSEQPTSGNGIGDVEETNAMPSNTKILEFYAFRDLESKRETSILCNTRKTSRRRSASSEEERRRR